jgi:ribonuclease R
MADKIGHVFKARISGVTRFGLFVTLMDSGASGLVPVSSLPDDFWMHDEATQTLSGRRTRLVFRLAQEVEARLSEASPVTGGMLFHILQGPRADATANPGPEPARRPVLPARRGGGRSRSK